MILMIDNYDSFTYNLVQYIAELGYKVEVFRNDRIDIERIKNLAPRKIVISPGPGGPRGAGISCEVIRSFAASIPLLGVCLGHQCIGHVYGAGVVGAGRLMHGKTSLVYHNSGAIFKNIPSPFEATRYHSLIVERKRLPDCLEVTAWTRQDEIMGLKHKDYPVWGLQFHPESILTKQGKHIIANFLGL